MAFNENIPQGSDNPSTSQGQILNNFQAINTAFNLNHGNFNDADQGKHDLIDLVRQTLPKAANATEGLLFSALVNGASELYYAKDGANGVQFTGLQPSTGGGTGTSYSWDFAIGLSIRFGSVSHTGTATTITFDTAFPNSAYVVLISPQGSAALETASNVQSLTTANFSINTVSSSAGVSYFYIALGR